MTSASELFHNRRSRFGRNPIELGLESSSLDRNHLHHQSYNRRHQNQNGNGNSRRDRHSNLDGCEPFRRSSHLRHPSNRPSHQERESVQLDHVSSQSASGNNINLENFSSTRSRLRSGGNDRLPGAVLLARERLLQRLRGVSLSGNRQINRASSGIFQNETTLADDFRLVDAEDWETGTSVDWPARGISFFDSISQTDRLLISEETNKRPPGLTQEALESLHLEVFSNKKKGSEGGMSTESMDCSICLESFMEGDELICLPCQHRFHSCCLDPWIRACGDCPYCRTGIAVSSYGGIKGR